MRKLYLISNYLQQLYDLSENDNCIIRPKDLEPYEMSVEETIALFKTNKTVECYGIIHAFIQEKTESGWKIIKDVL